jgi:hypothetical protein
MCELRAVRRSAGTMAVTYKIDDPNQRELSSKRDPNICPLSLPLQEKNLLALHKQRRHNYLVQADRFVGGGGVGGFPISTADCNELRESYLADFLQSKFSRTICMVNLPDFPAKF